MYELYQKLKDENNVRDAQVVQATGITQSTLSDWKAGRYTPKIDKLIKIANFFGVPVDYFISEKG